MDLLNELRADSNLWFSLIPSDILTIIEPFLYKYEYYEDGLLYSKSQSFTKDDVSILHGKRIFYEKNGNIIASYNIKHGQYYGLCVDYHTNGKKNYAQNYVDGNRHGICQRFYNDNQLREQSTWKYGVLDGISTTYNRDGTIVSKLLYKDGIFMGHVVF